LKNWTLKSLLQRLFGIFNPTQRKTFVKVVLLSFLNTLLDIAGLSLVIPVIAIVLSNTFYDNISNSIPLISSLTRNQLTLYAVGILLIAIVAKNLFSIVVAKVQARFMEDIFISSSSNVFRRVFDLPVQDLRKENSEVYMNKINNLQVSLCTNIILPAIVICNEIFVLLIVALGAIIWSPKLFFLLIITIMPFVAGFTLAIRDKVKTAGNRRNQLLQKQFGIAKNIIKGFTDIKIANAENYFQDEFESYTKESGKHLWQPLYYMLLPSRLMEIAVFLCIIILLLYSIFVLEDHSQIITTISLFTVIAYRMIPSITRVISSITNINNAQFILDDPYFLYQENKQEHQPHSLSFNKTIKFENVSYKYPGTSSNVINDCNLTIEKGTAIGIIGKSGSGKTTFINLLLGFIHPTEGKISIDNTEMNDIITQSWWQLVGYVRQDIFLVEKTLAENIALGISSHKINSQRLSWAISLANLDELVNTLPNSINTIIAEDGNNLSGGQKQRIAIARALYHGAEVLVFDEATSALDGENEYLISNALLELTKNNKTVILITHRYASLKHCNRIYQIDNGNFAVPISYSELLNRK
jgi:ABC-type bacteriocin/lantibiotic exporter with double-glycine peptidase domain